MGGFTAGLVLGCVLGVGGTLLSLHYGSLFSDSRATGSRWKFLFGILLSVILASGIVLFCHRLHIGRDASILLFLFVVLGISKLEGAVTALAASVVGVLPLAMWFFPPIGSFKTSDRLEFLLFLLTATIEIQWIHGRQPKHFVVNNPALER